MINYGIDCVPIYVIVLTITYQEDKQINYYTAKR
jgi:hypothetical protein